MFLIFFIISRPPSLPPTRTHAKSPNNPPLRTPLNIIYLILTLITLTQRSIAALQQRREVEFAAALQNPKLGERRQRAAVERCLRRRAGPLLLPQLQHPLLLVVLWVALLLETAAAAAAKATLTLTLTLTLCAGLVQLAAQRHKKQRVSQ